MMAQAVGLFAGAPVIFLTGWTLSIPSPVDLQINPNSVYRREVEGK
jgi:hypothetical protein